MNEQPGDIVRPVVSKVGTSPLPPRKLPYNAKHMPVGVSANTLGVVPRGAWSVRRMLFVGIPLVILLSLALGVWLVGRHLSPLGTKILSNQDYDYRFLFYKTAEQVNLAQGQGLQYSNQALAIARPTNDTAIQDCKLIGSGWHRAFIVPIEGREQQVCTLNNRAYLAIFYHGANRHLFEVTYTLRQPESRQKDVQAIMQSITVVGEPQP